MLQNIYIFYLSIVNHITLSLTLIYYSKISYYHYDFLSRCKLSCNIYAFLNKKKDFPPKRKKERLIKYIVSKILRYVVFINFTIFIIELKHIIALIKKSNIDRDERCNLLFCYMSFSNENDSFYHIHFLRNNRFI